MDEIALSLQMKRLAIWLDGQSQPEGFLQKQFDPVP
jgi:hypothetical protein